MCAGRRDPLTVVGLLMVSAGLILFNVYRIHSPTTHFFGGLLIGIGITLELAGMRRASRPSTRG